jgi:hypothetical protein
MSTARNRFGVSILVAWFLGAVLCGMPAAASASPATAEAAPVIASEEGFGLIEGLSTMTSTRTHAAVGAGAMLPLLMVGIMARRRLYAQA